MLAFSNTYEYDIIGTFMCVFLNGTQNNNFQSRIMAI